MIKVLVPALAAHADAAGGSLNSRLNWLRAGVLGANDGIVSTAGIVMGVAGATADRQALLIAGMAGLVAGALSMAGGEYVSVSSQKDTEIAHLARQARELAEQPEVELAVLARIYHGKGLSPATAEIVARELTHHDALAAHAEAELGISAEERTSPVHAALASAIAFFLGALIPLAAILLSPVGSRVAVTVAAVGVALALTGWTSARLGGAGAARPITRNLVVGALAMGLTWLVGNFVGGTTI